MSIIELLNHLEDRTDECPLISECGQVLLTVEQFRDLALEAGYVSTKLSNSLRIPICISPEEKEAVRNREA